MKKGAVEGLTDLCNGNPFWRGWFFLEPDYATIWDLSKAPEK